jgi:hypothetical protein
LLVSATGDVPLDRPVGRFDAVAIAEDREGRRAGWGKVMADFISCSTKQSKAKQSWLLDVDPVLEDNNASLMGLPSIPMLHQRKNRAYGKKLRADVEYDLKACFRSVA